MTIAKSTSEHHISALNSVSAPSYFSRSDINFLNTSLRERLSEICTSTSARHDFTLSNRSAKASYPLINLLDGCGIEFVAVRDGGVIDVTGTKSLTNAMLAFAPQ
jgi:hypothetical protein